MVNSTSVKTRYLDASALVKILIDEGDSQPVRDFFNSNTNFCATSICFAEALGVLKGKWSHNRISDNEYFAATNSLIIDAWGRRIEIDDVGLLNPEVHGEVERVAKKYNMDLSDALQLVTILRGKYSVLVRDSASALITADSNLVSAAASKNVRVWNCIQGPAPVWA